MEGAAAKDVASVGRRPATRPGFAQIARLQGLADCDGRGQHAQPPRPGRPQPPRRRPRAPARRRPAAPTRGRPRAAALRRRAPRTGSRADVGGKPHLGSAPGCYASRSAPVGGASLRPAPPGRCYDRAGRLAGYSCSRPRSAALEPSRATGRPAVHARRETDPIRPGAAPRQSSIGWRRRRAAGPGRPPCAAAWSAGVRADLGPSVGRHTLAGSGAAQRGLAVRPQVRRGARPRWASAAARRRQCPELQTRRSRQRSGTGTGVDAAPATSVAIRDGLPELTCGRPAIGVLELLGGSGTTGSRSRRQARTDNDRRRPPQHSLTYRASESPAFWCETGANRDRDRS